MSRRKIVEAGIIEMSEVVTHTQEIPASAVRFDSLRAFLTDVSKHPLLTASEERELAERTFGHKDREAAKRLVVSNLRLVVKMSLRYQNGFLNIRDLIQEGNVGLMYAVRGYNPYKGTKFSTYASFWIRAHITKYIRNYRSVVKAAAMRRRRRKGFDTQVAGQEIIDMPAYDQHLAEEADARAEELDEIGEEYSSYADVSLDQLAYAGGEESLLDLIDSGDDVEQIVAEKEKTEIIEKRLVEFKKRLNPKELFIFDHRVFVDDPMTLQQVGDRFSITRERARQIEKDVTARALKHLRRGLRPAVS